MKKLSLIAAALLLASSASFAADVSDSFAVSVTLTSKCTVKTTAGTLGLTYTAFQGLDASAAKTATFECTRGLAAPTFKFDTGTDATGSAAAASGMTGEGVVSGLRYTLAGVTSVNVGSDATAAAAGTATTYDVEITATIPSGQAGDASLASTQNRTLMMIY